MLPLPISMTVMRTILLRILGIERLGYPTNPQMASTLGVVVAHPPVNPSNDMVLAILLVVRSHDVDEMDH